MKNFTKVTEDFVCLNCGSENIGDGYTNHCSSCLHSLHVDESRPGDRQSRCQGIMDPVGVKLKGGQPKKILFNCRKCSKQILNKIAGSDCVSLIVKLPVVSL